MTAAIGTGSLHRELLLWLLLPQLVLWLAAAFVTYNLAARYADRGIDASLLQATRSLARQVKPLGIGLLIDFPRAAKDIIEADPADRFYYMVSTPPGQFILGNVKLPPPPVEAVPRLREPYFYDGRLDDTRLRLAALYLPIGTSEAPQVLLVQIARSQTGRDVLARAILLDTVLPLSALITLMSMIVWAGIRAGLAPLARMRRLVETRAPNDLAPLALKSAPQELQALTKAMNTLLAAVSESVVGQRRFISHAAHQLRTPLAGLKSQSELALADAGDNPALRQRLLHVHESAVRASRLINQLMALARAEPEAVTALPSERLSMRHLIIDLVAETVPQALQAGVDLGLDGTGDEAENRPDFAGDDHEDGDVFVRGNAVLLREAVLNLLDNAIRYAGRGAEVTVAVQAEGAMALVTVRDNGPGLQGDQHEAVFGRFVRATNLGNGCGLGLAIVREIAERHGGTIALHPVVPNGLQAELRLPLAPPARP